MLFSITVEEKPEAANELSGLMCMAISGGALIPLVMGKCVELDIMNKKSMAFLVPTICFVYLLLLSLRGGKKLHPSLPHDNWSEYGIDCRLKRYCSMKFSLKGIA